MILPLAIDVVLVAALWVVPGRSGRCPMALVQRSVPDVFLAALVASVIGLAWGVSRTIWRLRRHENPARANPTGKS